MNMDWTVKPLSRKSSISGELFELGAIIICHIFFEEHPEGPQLIRKDILQEEIESFELPKNLIAKWIRKIDHQNDSEQNQSLLNAEELFISLFNNTNLDLEENTEKHEELLKQKNTLKQLLALMLERKRILKRLKSKDKEIILYLHSATKKEYSIPESVLDLNEILKLQEQLTSLII